jgi:DNA-directed RNA polymerase subunit RPC12/RpoP
VERPPRNVEYVCLLCGSQGLERVMNQDEDMSVRGNLSVACPRCGGAALCVERGIASHVVMPAALDKR